VRESRRGRKSPQPVRAGVRQIIKAELGSVMGEAVCLNLAVTPLGDADGGVAGRG